MTKNSDHDRPGRLPSLLLGLVIGFGIGLPLDPSCNAPEMESQPMGKPSPPLGAR